jgi:outer membrane receptor for ferrienterochelin and colicin
LTKEADATARGYLEKSMFASRARKRLILKAEIKTKNDNLKKMRDENIGRGGEARKTMISTTFGKAFADMTKESRQRMLQWKRTEEKDHNDPQSQLTAGYMEQAYELQDWLLVFEIAMVTHLHVDQAVDETAMLQRQEMQLEKLKKLRHESGSLEKWLMKFKDLLEICDALGK